MNSRRNFLKAAPATAAFLGLPALTRAIDRNESMLLLDRIAEPRPATGKSVIDLTVPPIPTVRVGLIGLGNRGSFHVKLVQALSPHKAEIVAICDVREEKIEASKDYLATKGVEPAIYTGNPEAWKKMVARDDLDLILIATPWNDHARMGIYAMEQGKHVAIEVPIAVTLDEHWALVNTAEETQRNCMMLENVCYGAEELWVLNMISEGLFGTLTHGEAAYIHNIRQSLFTDRYYNDWRIRQHVKRGGNLYPTHGLGPIAQYMDIDRGDRFEYLVSMSSVQASMTEVAKTVPADDEFHGRTDFVHGDMNSSLLKTAKGRSILVQHDVVTPRPYSRINLIAGTKACHEGYPSRLSLIHKGHEWLSKGEYQEMWDKYQHPIWNRLEKEIRQNGGHGGMDFVMMYRLMDCLNRGLPLDMDVYDGVSWSVVGPLSDVSVELGSIPVRFPDFTRREWEKDRKLGILKYA